MIQSFTHDRLCPNCGGPIEVRNPTGKCDHLFYPDNVPKKISDAKRLDHITAIRKACVRANPDIFALKFGCRVHDGLNGGNIATFIGFEQEPPHKAILLHHEESCPHFEHVAEGLVSPIGRTVRLADVLLAIYALGPEMKTRLNVESDGQFLLYREPSRQKWSEATWNLRADNLEEQSDECVEFLYNLLKS